MASDDAFNRFAAEEFIPQYQLETGIALRLAFPELIFGNDDGGKVTAELVSVILAFINQEANYFDNYRLAFLDAIPATAIPPDGPYPAAFHRTCGSAPGLCVCRIRRARRASWSPSLLAFSTSNSRLSRIQI